MRDFLNKSIIILTIFIVGLFFISVASASDNVDAVCGDSANATSIVIEDANATVGYETSIVAKVTSDKSTVDDGIVTFYDDSDMLGNSSVAGGVASISFTPKNAGNHIITAIFTSDNYLSSNSSKTLNVDKARVDLVIEQIPAVHPSDPIRISVNITSNSKPVNEGTITYYVNGKHLGTGYIYNGRQVMIYTPDSTGAFDLEAVFGGTNNYYYSSENSTFSVVKKTKITSSGITTLYNGGKYLVAILADEDGNPIENTTLTIKINGALKSFTTDADGKVRMSTNGLIPKTYSAVISFAGNDNYENSTATAKVIVKKPTPKLYAKNKAFKINTKYKKYYVTLKTNKNQPMKKVKITLTVKGKTYRSATNSKGKATFKIINLTKKGKFNAVIKYSGNKYYKAIKKKVKITLI